VKKIFVSLASLLALCALSAGGLLFIKVASMVGLWDIWDKMQKLIQDYYNTSALKTWTELGGLIFLLILVIISLWNLWRKRREFTKE